MDEIIEDEVRERVCEENFQRMQTVKRNFKIARIFNIYLGLVVLIFSWGFLFIWITHTGTGIRKSINMLAEEPEAVLFPWYAVTAFFSPGTVLLSFLADNTKKRIFSALAWLAYLIMILFAVGNYFLEFEPMKLSGMLILAAYGFLGLWSQDFALRSYKELEYLSGQEGYPDFNFNLEKGRYSRYVKYRNSWLKKKKEQDYYTPSERPAEKPVILRTESETQMEGIAVGEEDSVQWFTQKENISEEISSIPDTIFDPVPKPEIADGETAGAMGELQTEGEGVIPQDMYDDPRHRPL